MFPFFMVGISQRYFWKPIRWWHQGHKKSVSFWHSTNFHWLILLVKWNQWKLVLCLQIRQFFSSADMKNSLCLSLSEIFRGEAVKHPPISPLHLTHCPSVRYLRVPMLLQRKKGWKLKLQGIQGGSKGFYTMIFIDTVGRIALWNSIETNTRIVC